nr:hypothetical protein [Kofleriaceae bacterium]
MTDEADRLIDAALRDHARVPAPARLKRKLAATYQRRERRWLAPALSGVGGAVAAALAVWLIMRGTAPTAPPPGDELASLDAATEAVGDHQRVLGARGLGVVASDMHQVKPWFAGKLDFVPPVSFLGDDEFPLHGGDVAVFRGHKAAAFVYGARLHVISLFVYEAAPGDAAAADEHTIRGFHVTTWTTGGTGFALVSDVNWDDLRRLRNRLSQ